MIAPEKIYIQPNAHDGWFETNNLNESLTEYTRTDAMLEKVYDFIRINAYKYRQLKFVKNKATFDFRTDRLIEDLRKAMEE